MSRRLLVLIPMLALVLSAQAREQSASHSESHAESSSRSTSQSQSQPQSQSQAQDSASRGRSAQDLDAQMIDRQRRRDVLREALRTQPEEVPVTARQMSLQERSEFRQQLRQQQEWLK